MKEIQAKLSKIEILNLLFLCRLPGLAEATYTCRDHFCRLALASQKNFCHIFLWNHTGQLPDIWHRASVWRTVSCNTVLNLRHVHFLFDATMNIQKKRSRQVTHVFPGRLTTKFYVRVNKHYFSMAFTIDLFLKLKCLNKGIFIAMFR